MLNDKRMKLQGEEMSRKTEEKLHIKINATRSDTHEI
jgi:hypothetical protein